VCTEASVKQESVTLQSALLAVRQRFKPRQKNVGLHAHTSNAGPCARQRLNLSNLKSRSNNGKVTFTPQILYDIASQKRNQRERLRSRWNVGFVHTDKTKMVWIGEYVPRLLFVSGQERTSVRGTMEAHRFDNDARYAGIKIQNPLG
jgi:hypothetical protein